MTTRDITNDQDWLDFSHEWAIRPDTLYMNHGSFGPPPRPVKYARRRWIDALDEQPMDFYVRLLEPAVLRAREATSEFVGTALNNLVLVENATFGMNVVADSFPLKEGDEVLLNNHEYGAVHRIWERICRRTGAIMRSVDLPRRIDSQEEVVQSILSGVNENTRLVVVSHVTSATALIMPVQQICEKLRERGVAVCIDGPHAPAQIELNIDQLGCDFYTASCHKWLCGNLGSGFLVVHPRWHTTLEPQLKSWGRLLPAIPERWFEEFTWSGTRDPSVYLTVPDAIEFMKSVGLQQFRERTYWLAAQARDRLAAEFGGEPLADPSKGWYGCMAHMPLPSGDWTELQHRLWNQHGIEVPIIHFENDWFVRVSCHLYNHQIQLDTLVKALWLETR
ncbi:MAG: aminotransferase class V-fold PLP-dependent enzyme [Mariniblastus sp.]|nr:aminotransferase class V-fold PLP-dependent enzyme [Mariniblastus sp.]